MEIDLTVQYIIVGAIIFLAIGWVGFRLFRKKKPGGKGGSCCGCSLSESCSKSKQLRDHDK